MTAPAQLIQWINDNLGFNPRAGKYSDALGEFVIIDLLRRSRFIAQRTTMGTLEAELNADVATKSATRNVDLVIWGRTPQGGDRTPHLALENKLILAAHGKARKNRLGDIVAFSNHIHNADRLAVAGGLIGVNLSEAYANPDPFAAGMERQRFNMHKVVEDTLEIYARIPQRDSPDEPFDRPEAFGVVVFLYDGKTPARLVADPPAPQPGEPLHYETFITRLVGLYERRRAA
jgi:hypothetical protein